MSEPTLVELVELIEQGRESRARIDEKLVNGCLLVTPKQYKQLKESDPDRTRNIEYPNWISKPSIGDINVVVIYPNRPPQDVGNGWAAINVDDTIYAFERSKMWPHDIGN